MPLFYFDVCDGLRGLDRIGRELPDAEAARREALRRAEKLLTDEAEWFLTGHDWQIGVVDAAHAPVFCLKFMATTGAMVLIRNDRNSQWRAGEPH